MKGSSGSTALERREFLRRLSVGALAALPVELSGPPSAPAAQKAFRLRPILASCLFGNLPLAQIVPQVKKTGTDKLDIWPLPHGSQREEIEAMGLDRFRALAMQHGVRVGMFSLYNQKRFKIDKEIELLADLGGKLIVTAGGIRSPAKWIQNHHAVLDQAQRLGVRVAVENHGETPQEIRHFAEQARKVPALGVALAPLHLPQDADLIARLAEDLSSKLFHVYAWQFGVGHDKREPELAMLQLPGFGKLDFQPLLAALRRIDYRGWTEVFMHPTPRGVPILPKAEEITAAVNRSRAYLDSCLATATQ